MSPLAHLHARYDGPIPAAERLAALAAERLHAAAAAPAAAARVALHVTAWSANAVRQMMASAMTLVVLSTGCCTEADLARFGFTPDQIREHGAAARAIVAAQLAADDPVYGGAA